MESTSSSIKMCCCCYPPNVVVSDEHTMLGRSEPGICQHCALLQSDAVQQYFALSWPLFSFLNSPMITFGDQALQT